jgi:hypothetical protein
MSMEHGWGVVLRFVSEIRPYRGSHILLGVEVTERLSDQVMVVYVSPPIPPQQGGGFGVAALICGILGINLLAIVFGVIGWQPDRKNRGLAIAGFVLGCIWILVCIIFWSIIFGTSTNLYY